MKLCILIIAHKNLVQLNKLIDTLKHKDITVFVHVDQKSTININEISKNGNIIKNRTSIKRGRFSQVEATLSSIKEILKSGKEFDYLAFISGQDYPIISCQDMIDFFKNNKKSQFLRCSRMDTTWETSTTKRYNPLTRYQYYYFDNRYMSKCLKIIMKILHIKRKFITGFTAYHGSSWWTLTRECIEYIDGFVDKNKDFVKYFNKTNCADEFFFQTVIKNSDFGTEIIDNNLRYLNWDSKNKNPSTLTVKDIDKIMSSEKHFARKLDMDVDTKIFELIDSKKEKNFV